ncbi:MAG: 2-amino-4-deoxychorismate synthase [Nocardioidaceae bacterium]|nr:2-amino-4-deoxychorismate synthase [Nocardioidaceae bacterium]
MTVTPESPADTPGARLEDLLAKPAWALVRLHDADEVILLGGGRNDHAVLRDIPLESGPPSDGRRFDRLVCVPFAQIRERGFDVHDDGTPFCSIAIEAESRVPVDELLSVIPRISLQTRGSAGFAVSDTDYAALVETIIRDEIGNGEGANLVVARDFLATLDDWDALKALGVFAQLLRQERGAYWTFLVFTGDRYLVGASPERHVSVQGGEVSMNPISGTFRLDDVTDPSRLEEDLRSFLADPKEIYELFMVVDEELKMMCALCSSGGSILGPFLKPMSHLVHTEYLLAGRTSLDVRDVLRDSMFAATVTGSPVENACRLIRRYEPGGRGYYGSVLVLVGRDEDGDPTVDAPIVLRTADVSLDGRLRVTAGATLVRDSQPWSEVAETHAKAAGILAAFGLVLPASTTPTDVASLMTDPSVLAALALRNNRLSNFWLADQSGAPPSPSLAGRQVVVLDGEDEFVTMLRHMLGVLGMKTSTVSHRDYQPGDLDGADLVIVGPGPGDPRDLGDPKIATVRGVVDELLSSRWPFLAVCLGHQVLCGALGLELAYKDIVFQGTQTKVDVLGRHENVGFYNTFVARVGSGRALPAGVSVSADDATGDVHLVRGPHFVGVQFHMESILTENGFDLVREIVTSLLPGFSIDR